MATNEVYVCLRRSDIPAQGVLAVTDLKPSKGDSNQVYDSAPQPKYVHRVDNDKVRTTGSVVTVASFKGLAAYLIDNVVSGGLAGGTGCLSAIHANAAADLIVSAMDAGHSLTLGYLNTLLEAVADNTELTNAGGSLSTGLLSDVLRILAGARYTLPVAQVSTGGVKTVRAGAFNTTTRAYQPLWDSGDFTMSLYAGQLSQFLLDTFDPGNKVEGVAVVCYDSEGNALPHTDTPRSWTDVQGGIRTFKTTVNYTALSIGAGSKTLSFTEFPKNALVFGANVVVNTPFVAGGLGSITLNLGDSGKTDQLLHLAQMFGVTGGQTVDDALSSSKLPTAEPAYGIQGVFAADVNFDTFTAGNITIQVFYIDLNQVGL